MLDDDCLFAAVAVFAQGFHLQRVPSYLDQVTPRSLRSNAVSIRQVALVADALDGLRLGDGEFALLSGVSRVCLQTARPIPLFARP